MVPMRDGTKLYTVIVMKKGTADAPILLSRTPYDAKGSTSREPSQSDRRHPADHGQGVRQRRLHQRLPGHPRAAQFAKAQFVMNRPIVGPLNNTGIDESTDAYDTIDWLVKNVPEVQRQGRHDRLVLPRLPDAGVGDQSAPGAQGRGAAKPDGRRLDGRRLVPQRRVPHRQPRLRRVAEHRQGGRRRASRSAPATITRATSRPARWPTTPAGSASSIIRSSRSCSRTRPTPNSGRCQAVDKWMAARPLTVPTMLEVGQWDQEDSYGAPAVYKALKRQI